MYQTKHSPNVLRILVLLTTLFVLGQIACVALYQHFNQLSPVTRYALSVPSILNATSLQPLSYFLFAQFILYLTYVFLLWHMSISVGRVFNLSSVAIKFTSFFFWANSIVTIVLLNTFLMPHSFFSKLLFANTIPSRIWLLVLIASSLINIAALCISFVLMLIDIVRFKNLTYQWLLFVLAAFMVAATLQIYSHVPTKLYSTATNVRPNIFIICFDGVRPDFINFFNLNAAATPGFDEFMRNAVIFSRDYTPLAHTAPAWASILTGLYPLHHKIREDQTLLDLVKIDNALPKQLQAAGYQTIFATDERSYNNIDERFGFDKIIGPSGAASNFIITTINDFPLSNLVAVSPFGKYLFPQNYLNRSAANIYRPEHFLNEISSHLALTSNKPLFLAIHFNLSAYPYYWFGDKMDVNASSLSLYQNAIHHDDVLFSQLIALLKANHYLDNALVFVTSDHGITHGLAGDRITVAKDYEGSTQEFLKDIDKSAGYGNDLLSLKQHLNLLAFQAFGLDVKPHVINARTSLTDITPTILDMINASNKQYMDGVSLKAAILNNDTLPERPLYFETGIQQSEKNLMLQNSYYYMTARNGAVAIYPPLLKLLSTNKQRGVLMGDWYLIYLPKNNFLNTKHGFVLMNMKTGRWTTEINSFSKDAPIDQLKQKLADFYGDEMAVYQSFQS